MPKFAANLTMLFTEVPFMERFSLARQAGFTEIEYLFPYDYSVEELQSQLKTNNLKQVLFNLPAGRWAEGERGIGANPERVEEFQAGVGRAVEYARGLGVNKVNLLAGKKVSNFSDEEQWDTLVQNIRYAADVLQKNDITLVIEAINQFDIPGFILNRTDQVMRLIAEADRPNVLFQYDIYHAQRQEGELTATLRKHIAKIGHIQIADNPGRHQPGTGEINYPFLFREIDALGYDGYIGLEYIPSPDTASSLKWIAEVVGK